MFVQLMSKGVPKNTKVFEALVHSLVTSSNIILQLGNEFIVVFVGQVHSVTFAAISKVCFAPAYNPPPPTMNPSNYGGTYTANGPPFSQNPAPGASPPPVASPAPAPAQHSATSTPNHGHTFATPNQASTFMGTTQPHFLHQNPFNMQQQKQQASTPPKSNVDTSFFNRQQTQQQTPLSGPRQNVFVHHQPLPPPPQQQQQQQPTHPKTVHFPEENSKFPPPAQITPGSTQNAAYNGHLPTLGVPAAARARTHSQDESMLSSEYTEETVPKQTEHKPSAAHRVLVETVEEEDCLPQVQSPMRTNAKRFFGNVKAYVTGSSSDNSSGISSHAKQPPKKYYAKDGSGDTAATVSETIGGSTWSQSARSNDPSL